jgi:hypothetical protein
MDPCPSSTRELPPARPGAVDRDDVALVAEPPHRPAHGGLGRGDRGGELGDGEGPGGAGESAEKSVTRQIEHAQGYAARKGWAGERL